MLTNFVSVYVPSTVDVNTPASQEKIADVIRFVSAKFAAKFGGSTVTTAKGYWIADNGELVEDNITIVKSFHADEGAFAFACEIAQFVKEALTQEAVTVETNQGIEFI